MAKENKHRTWKIRWTWSVAVGDRNISILERGGKMLGMQLETTVGIRLVQNNKSPCLCLTFVVQ